MFFWNVKRAKSNVRKYEAKLDRKELRGIILAIEKASKYGFDSIEIKGQMREGSINILKNAGYEIDKTAKKKYVIYW